MRWGISFGNVLYSKLRLSFQANVRIIWYDAQKRLTIYDRAGFYSEMPASLEFKVFLYSKDGSMAAA